MTIGAGPQSPAPILSGTGKFLHAHLRSLTALASGFEI